MASKWEAPKLNVGDICHRLTVVQCLGNKHYLCRCECGNTVDVLESRLLSGKIKSCGCGKTKQFVSYNGTDLPVGSTCHTLTFLGETRTEGKGDASKRMYLCRCSLCNHESWHEKRLFKQGYASCECEKLSKRRMHLIEVLKKYRVKKFPQKGFTEVTEGDRFGKLVVLKRTENPPKDRDRIWYDCQCDCGRVIPVRKRLLVNGSTTSCGCYLKKSFQLRRTYPDWLRPILADDEARQKLDRKEYRLYEDMLPFVCSKCGKRYMKDIKHVLEYEYKIPICPACSMRTRVFEEEVAGYIRDMFPSIEIIRHDQSMIGKELDIYLPEHRIAIECNGDYWHSMTVRNDRMYHYRAWEACMEKGIRLVQIFQTDWNLRGTRWKRFFDSLLAPKQRIYARSLTLHRYGVSDRERVREFFEDSHIQGCPPRMSYMYGLEDEDGTIYGMMSFIEKQYVKHSRNEGCYELNRYATRYGYSVVGGASRLLCAFEREVRPVSIVSYSDCDVFSGDMYAKLGFVREGYSSNYFWTDGRVVFSRKQCQLNRLEKIHPDLYREALEKDAPNKEDYVMEALGYHKVFRAGRLRWVKVKR